MKKQHSFNVPKGNIEEAIIELYLSVKIRKREDIDRYHEKELRKEMEALKTTNPLILIEYIKNSIPILIDIKVNEKIREKEMKPDKFFSYYGNDETVNEYEKLLRKAEADIRNYIKIEHQLKLNVDALLIKNEEMEKIFMEVKSTNTKRDKALKSKAMPGIYYEEDISALKKENSYLNQVIKTYELHNLKIPTLEKKLRNQKIEMENLDSYYKTKIRSYSKKLEKYEEAIKSGYIHNASVIKINDEYFSNSNVTTNTLQGRNNLNISAKKGRSQLSEADAEVDADARFQNFRTVETSPQAEQECPVKNLKKIRLDDTDENSLVSASITEDKDGNTIEIVTKIRDVKKATRSRSNSNSKGTGPFPFLLKNIMVNNESKTERYVTNPNPRKIIKHHPSNIPTPYNTSKNSQIILQQNGIPCYNNINIFTNGIQNIKNGDVSIEQFILGNKVLPSGKMKPSVSKVLHSSPSSTLI